MNEEQLRRQLAEVYSSTSWRITAPLRFLGNLFRRRYRPLAALKRSVFELIRVSSRNELLRRLGRRVFVYFPRLKSSVRRILFQHTHERLAARSQPIDLGRDHIDLSSESQLILRQLKLLNKDR